MSNNNSHLHSKKYCSKKRNNQRKQIQLCSTHLVNVCVRVCVCVCVCVCMHAQLDKLTSDFPYIPGCPPVKHQEYSWYDDGSQRCLGYVVKHTSFTQPIDSNQNNSSCVGMRFSKLQ